MEQQEFKYFAFISYSSHDTKWGKRIHKKLEYYRMPTTLCSKHGWKRKPMSPIFFAPYDIQPGGLSEELQERLRASRNLIVICSPNSAQSEWVGKEIEFFHQLGRTKQIHFFIVDGQPHSEDPNVECFNPIVDTLRLPEILGANIHERIYRWPWLNKERAYAQLISKLLGVEFDTIWQRHRRLLIQKAVVWVVGIIAVLATLLSVWLTSQPVDVEVRLREASVHNPNLPPLKDAVVTLTLDNEVKTCTIPSLSDSTVFTNIPYNYMNHSVGMCIDCPDFLPTDTVLQLSRKVTLNIQRDPQAYGDIHFVVWSLNRNTAVTGIKMKIADHEVVSDGNGKVQLFVPLEEQQPAYHITSSVPLEQTDVRTPCDPGATIVIKE